MVTILSASPPTDGDPPSQACQKQDLGGLSPDTLLGRSPDQPDQPGNGPEDEGAQRKGEGQISHELIGVTMPRLHGFCKGQQEHTRQNHPGETKANNQEGKYGARHDGHGCRECLGHSIATGASSMTKSR